MANKVSKKSEAVEERSFSQKAKDYFLSLRLEWQKVSFPSRKELTQSTIVVFLFTVLLMTVIALYDFAVGWFFKAAVL